MRELTGVILAGGRGSRLGRNKARVTLSRPAHGEFDLLQHTMGMLEEVCGKAMVVGQDIPGYPCHTDASPGHGPMGGIATALAIAEGPCLVLSCDLPFMNTAMLEKLVRAYRERPEGALSTAYMERDTGRIEALVAVYGYETRPLFQSCVDRNLLKISLTVPREQQHFLTYGPEEAHHFFNINYPEDLEKAQLILLAGDPDNAGTALGPTAGTGTKTAI